MFRNKTDSSFELAAYMEQYFSGNSMEKQAATLNKYAKALECIQIAAECFEDIGLEAEAEAATYLLEIVAAKKKKKTKTKTKNKSKAKNKTKKSVKKPMPDLSPEKMVENLKEKGWVFNAHDDGCDCSMCSDTNWVEEEKPIEVEYEKTTLPEIPTAKRPWSEWEEEPEEVEEEIVDLPVVKHRANTILPIPNEEVEVVDLPSVKHYQPETKNWRDIEETAKETMVPPARERR